MWVCFCFVAGVVLCSRAVMVRAALEKKTCAVDLRLGVTTFRTSCLELPVASFVYCAMNTLPECVRWHLLSATCGGLVSGTMQAHSDDNPSPPLPALISGTTLLRHSSYCPSDSLKQ